MTNTIIMFQEQIYSLHKAKSTQLSLHNTTQFYLIRFRIIPNQRGGNLNRKDNQLNLLPT